MRRFRLGRRSSFAGGYTLLGGVIAGGYVWSANHQSFYCEEDCDNVGRWRRHSETYDFPCEDRPRLCKAIRNSRYARLGTYSLGFGLLGYGRHVVRSTPLPEHLQDKPLTSRRAALAMAGAGAGLLAGGTALLSRLSDINRRNGIGEAWTKKRAHGKRLSAGVSAGAGIYTGSILLFHGVINAIIGGPSADAVEIGLAWTGEHMRVGAALRF